MLVKRSYRNRQERETKIPLRADVIAMIMMMMMMMKPELIARPL